MVKPENKREKYAFLRLYDMDLEMSLQTISVLQRYRRKDVRFPLLRDIIVSYCRPFIKSRGKGIKGDLHGVKFQNKDMESLHEELLTLRHQLFAHTDLNYKNPKIVNWSKGGYKWFPMSFKGFDYDYLDDKVPEIKKLIKYVQIELRKRIKRDEKSLL